MNSNNLPVHSQGEQTIDRGESLARAYLYILGPEWGKPNKIKKGENVHEPSKNQEHPRTTSNQTIQSQGAK